MNFWKTFSASLLAWVAGVILVFVFFIGSLISAIVSSISSEESIITDSVLYIDLKESIVDAPTSSLFGGMSLSSLEMDTPITLVNALTAIEKASSDPEIKGICLNIDDSGTVSVAKIEELRAALVRLSLPTTAHTRRATTT